MKKTLKKLSLAAMLLLILPVIIACGDDENGNKDVSEELDNLIVGTAVEPRTLDIHGSNDVASTQVARQIFETLVFQDEDMNIIPGLAHSWEQYNDRVWEFQLNDEVYFHNGAKMTAYDVEATFLRAAVSPQVTAILGMIDVDTIEVVDELTIRVGTLEPFAPFLSHLAHASASIMNADVLAEASTDDQTEELDADIDRLPIGTGPFQLENASDWVSGNSIVLTRFEDYHETLPDRNLPEFNKLTFRFVADSNARLAALETGEIHIDLNPVTDYYPRIESTDGLRLESIEGLRTEYLGMNSNHPYLGNHLVRQAINYAIDVDAIGEAIYQGHGTIGQTYLAANAFGHNPNIEGFPFDVDRAKELMAEAGLEDGFSVVLHANSERQDRVNIAQIIEQQLGEINIDVTIEQMEWAQLLTILDEGESDMFLLGWTAVTGDGDYGLYPLLHSSQHGSAGNYTRFTNAEIDRLLDAARMSIDVQERLDFYFEAQEILREEAPWVVMIQEQPSAVINYNVVHNFVLNPIGTHYLGDVTLGE